MPFHTNIRLSSSSEIQLRTDWCLPGIKVSENRRRIRCPRVYFVSRSDPSNHKVTLFKMKAVMISLLVAVGTVAVGAQRNAGQFTGIACQYTNLQLSCQRGKVLKIEAANYGRRETSICPGANSASGGLCEAADSLKLVERRCNQQTPCSIPADNDFFGNPCVGTFKYLEVDYSCVDAIIVEHQVIPEVPSGQITGIACEGKYLRISCQEEEGRVINIEAANYGSRDASVCSQGYTSSMAIIPCGAAHSLDLVKRRCNQKKFCAIPAKNHMFGNPCRPGVFKYLEVVYSCVCPPMLCLPNFNINDEECTCECGIEECPSPQYLNATSCQCECPPTQCEPNFVFNSDTCACECLADCHPNFMPDSESCSCVCPPMLCLPNFNFNAEKCACECGIEECPTPQYLNTGSCQCECPPTQCEPNFVFNSGTCACECLADCPPNFMLDSEACACVCPPMLCLPNFHFNAEECACECPEIACARNYIPNPDTCACDCGIESCDSPKIFDADNCRCVAVEEPPECPATKCSRREILNEDTCECECKPRKCKGLKVLNMDTCRCDCGIESCDPPKIFDADNCRCECPATKCSRREVLNKTTCECDCKPRNCKEHKVLNMNTCRCDCHDVVCQKGYKLNRRTCKCRCKRYRKCKSPQFFSQDTCQCEGGDVVPLPLV